MIELIDFSKTYKSCFHGNKIAVEKVSLTAKPGLVTGRLGLNEAGKTTIIKAICAEHYPTSGNVYVYDGKEKIDASVFPEKVHGLVGYVSETPCLYEDMTVKEFLNLMSELRIGDKSLRQKA